MKDIHQLIESLTPAASYNQDLRDLLLILTLKFEHDNYVIDKAHEAMMRLEADTGKRPSFLYLGRKESRAMEGWFKLMVHSVYKPAGACEQPAKTFNGSTILEVNADSHLSVS